MNKLAFVLPYALLLSPLTCLNACSDDDGNSETTSGTNSTTTTGSNSTDTTNTSTTTTSTSTDSTTQAACVGFDGPRVNLDLANEGDRTLTCDKVYVLAGHTFWNSGTLTIQAGTKILGFGGSSLVINSGAKLHAVGTESDPIVLTSSALATGEQPAPGDWGGLILVGNAITNLEGGKGLVEGFTTPLMYGGTDPTHNCGTLQYLRVEYAGYVLTEGSEINGITFYTCGSQTVADHLQVRMGSDDGIEFFGGGFNLNHLVLTGNDDDSLDIDQGFTGKIQYVLAQHGPGSGDYALEWSNQANRFDAPPLTNPMIANATLIGSDGAKSKGWTNKEGNQGHVYCSIFTKFPNETLYLTNIQTQTQLEAGQIELKNSIFFGNAAPLAKTCLDVDPTKCDVTKTGAELEAWAKDPANANRFDVDPLLTNTNWGTVDPKPAAGSPAATGCTVPAGFEAAAYVGAVDPAAATPWTSAAWIVRN